MVDDNWKFIQDLLEQLLFCLDHNVIVIVCYFEIQSENLAQ